MKRYHLWMVVALVAMVGILYLFPESAFAQWAGTGGGFESKMSDLTSKLVTVVLPILSILGLVYAVFLALTGDASGKGRIIMVIVCSIVGFLAPSIIRWLQSASGS